MGFFGFIGEWINANPGKTIGVLAGLTMGILIFTLGALKTALIALLIFIGYIIGKSRDDQVSVIDEITGLFKSGPSKRGPRRDIDDIDDMD